MVGLKLRRTKKLEEKMLDIFYKPFKKPKKRKAKRELTNKKKIRIKERRGV